MTSLTAREKKILQMRFGLVDGFSHTLEEIGNLFNVTRERIRQIEAKALRKLRHPTRAQQLRGFLDTQIEGVTAKSAGCPTPGAPAAPPARPPVLPVYSIPQSGQ